MITPRDLQDIRKVRKAGFVNPIWTVTEAKRAKLPLSYALAFLEKESARGHNVFGSDAVRNPIKGGYVTEARYRAYVHYRDSGYGCQGVGPLQLTYDGFQKQADAQGGCWRPQINLRVGFGVVASLIKQHGLRSGVKSWNGTGPAADAYVVDWLAKQRKWQDYIGKV